ncbi:hypothetical protein N7486_011477 [Penicillium sp. IBT 16267x]|nr:hypothetical protein N7486_011477 [Penicillium sp. IBT 16267x]
MPSITLRSLSGQGQGVFIGVTVSFIIASIFFVARLFSRFGITKYNGWDDVFIIIAWVLALGLSVSVDYASSKGLGRHNADIPESWISPLLASEYAFTILYNPALMATKTSILMFYLHISKRTQRFLRVSSYVTLAAVNIGGLIVTFFSAFRCHPLQAAYKPSIPNARCTPILDIYLASAPLNVATDLAILVLPIPVLTGIHLPRKQKAVVVLLFSLFIFATIVDVVRIYYLQLASTRSNSAGPIVLDHSLVSTALLWSTVEVNVAITCACIPILKPLVLVLNDLVQSLLPGIFSDYLSFGGYGMDSTPQSLQRNSSEPKDKQLPTSPSVHSPPSAVNVQSTRGQEHDTTITASSALPTLLNSEMELQTMHREPAESTRLPFKGSFIASRPASMLSLRGWQCWKYCIVVTTVYFVWGFTYGILTSLTTHTPNMTNRSLAQVVSIVSVLFGSTLPGALLIGHWVLRFAGFKATLITGLVIYCVGTLMYWPSGALNSYPAFVISNFVVGLGLAVGEVAAFLFLVLCGAPEYAESRLLLAQGILIVASILSGLLSRRVFLVDVVSTQWVYLGCTFAVTLLALFLYYIRLPEVSDAELQSQTDALRKSVNQSCFDKQRVILLNHVLFFVALFFFQGGAQSLEIFFAYLLPSVAKATHTAQTLSTDVYYMVGTAMYAFARFLFAFLCLFIPSRILLLVSVTGATVFSALTMGLQTHNVNSTTAYGLMIVFFEGPFLPLIFTLSLRGLGRWTKLGGAVMVAAQCGACVFPFVQFAAVQSHGHSVQYSFCIQLAVYAVATAFAVYINLFQPLRDQLDLVAFPLGVLRRRTISTAGEHVSSGGLGEATETDGFRLVGINEH